MLSHRVRYRVVLFAVALAGVTYLDRISIGVLAPAIMHDLKISQLQMGFVFAAFTLAYSLFEIPTAWWADRIKVGTGGYTFRYASSDDMLGLMGARR